MIKTFTDVTDAINKVLPGEMADDIRKNIDAVVRSNFEKMKLVTRDQLEVQEKVLQRTREKLHMLEKQVAELKQQLDKSD